MQRTLWLQTLVLVSMVFGAGIAQAAEKIVDIYQLNDNSKDNGIGAKIGTITFTDTKKGLQIKPNLKGLPAGNHGFHVHQNPSCEGGEKAGKYEPGLGAGDHYDPEHTGKHLGPYAHGHLGDMPFLVVNRNGVADHELFAPHLTVAELENRTIMIHAHGDNYSDKPQPLGGGGPRIACGVVK